MKREKSTEMNSYSKSDKLAIKLTFLQKYYSDLHFALTYSTIFIAIAIGIGTINFQISVSSLISEIKSASFEGLFLEAVIICGLLICFYRIYQTDKKIRKIENSLSKLLDY